MHVDQILAEFTAPLWTWLGEKGIAALLMLIAIYFVIKWAVKKGIKEALKEMKETGK